MSGKSSSYVKFGSERPLRNEEKTLLRALLPNDYADQRIESALAESKVEEMLDGGMGSVRFVGKKPCDRHLGKVIRKAKYVDSDGVPVMISVNLDQDDNLYEVDFWKVDFSPLSRYPTVADLEIEGD